MNNSTNKIFKFSILSLMLAFIVLNAYSKATIFTVATADGFAKNTTGGAGGDTVVVATLAEFKAAVEASEKKIVVVKGSINLGDMPVAINSDKTVIGENTYSKITGNLNIKGKRNVIVQNLSITNVAGVGSGDGIEISESINIFVTKCTLIDCKDGSIDIVRASDSVTLSWNRYQYPTRTSHNFPNLIGNGDDKTDDRGKLHVTLHHNWFDNGVIERMPRVRYGRVHCYNNYYSSNLNNYCVGVGNESQILVENCYFNNQKTLWMNWSSSAATQGLIQWRGLYLENSSYPTWAPNSIVFDPSLVYDYFVMPASEVKGIVMESAGNTASNFTTPEATLFTSLVTGEGSVNPTKLQSVSGTTITISAVAENGWKFERWSGDTTGTVETIDIVLSSDISVTANFTELPKFSFASSVVGEGTVEPANDQYYQGTTLSVLAKAATGWKFDSWSGDTISVENPIKLTISSNISVEAKFIEVSNQINDGKALDISLFPNPANKLLTIKFTNEFIDGGEIQLFDCAGKMLLEDNMEGSVHTLNLESLPKGMYVIKVSTKNELIVKQVAKY